MKVIILTLCVFIGFLNFANAGETYRCIDLDGNTIITDAPQDGMKCVSKDDDTESIVNSGGKTRELMMSLDDTFRVEETKDWNVEVKRILTLRFADVLITPKHGYDFSMMLYFKCDTEDLSQFDTPEKISTSIRNSSEKYLTGTIEKKVTLRTIPIKSTYGYYTILTDAEIAAKSKLSPGEFKYLTRGMVRLSKDSALGFSIMTNDTNSADYKKLLKYVYSFIKYPK